MKPNRAWNGLLAAALGSAFNLAATTGPLRADNRVNQAVAVVMKLCLAGGSVISSKASSDPAGGKFRLESDKGNFTVESREAWGLVQGIDAALNNLSVDQANRARDCMRPYISQVLAIIIGAPPPGASLPSAANPPLLPPTSDAAVARNPRTEGVPIVYYLKPADGSSVTEALKRRGISFTQLAAVLTEPVRTNALFCAPGTPAEAIRELALALTDAGIPVRAIERIRRKESQTTNALFVISRLGHQGSAIISAPLSKAQIASITECPDDRYGGGISNFSRFENPHPTANVNDTRYVDATGGDVDATAFCKQRGFFDNVGWKTRTATGANVVATRLTDHSYCTQDCNAFTLILCE